MMPSFFVHIDEMPVTPGGKIDKKALPVPEVDVNNTSYVEPVTMIQKTLCEIFEKALGTEKVGIEDNFFVWRLFTYRIEGCRDVSFQEYFDCICRCV